MNSGDRLIYSLQPYCFSFASCRKVHEWWRLFPILLSPMSSVRHAKDGEMTESREFSKILRLQFIYCELTLLPGGSYWPIPSTSPGDQYNTLQSS